jgi:5-methylcytosine-specific restriction endonuclease McrA
MGQSLTDCFYITFYFSLTGGYRIVPDFSQPVSKERSRNIPLKVRLAVLKRDNYRCVLCGRSPATHRNISLHLDHKHAYANGGKTTQENLQTLCEDCNWGKGKDALDDLENT